MGSLREQNQAHFDVNQTVVEKLQQGLSDAQASGKTFVKLWHAPDGLHQLVVDEQVVAMVAGATEKLQEELTSSAGDRRVDPWDMHTWPPEGF